MKSRIFLRKILKAWKLVVVRTRLGLRAAKKDT